MLRPCREVTRQLEAKESSQVSFYFYLQDLTSTIIQNSRLPAARHHSILCCCFEPSKNWGNSHVKPSRVFGAPKPLGILRGIQNHLQVLRHGMFLSIAEDGPSRRIGSTTPPASDECSTSGTIKKKTTAKFSMEPKWVAKVDFLIGYGHKYVCH